MVQMKGPKCHSLPVLASCSIRTTITRRKDEKRKEDPLLKSYVSNQIPIKDNSVSERQQINL